MDEHKMYKYSVKSPTRVDLAGGLLDIWPVYALVPDCVVLNFSIPVFTSVQTENDVISAQTERQVVAFPSHEAGSHFGGFPSREKCHSRESGNPEKLILDTYFQRDDNSSRGVSHVREARHFDKAKIDVSIFSPSGSYKNSFTSLNNLLKDSSDELRLLKTHLEYWSRYMPKEQVFLKSISLRSESPVGGGLGASSSLCVGLAKVLSSVLKKELTKNELLMLCRDLETSLLHAPAGVQDYVPAIEEEPDFLYVIECISSGPKWSRKKIPIAFFKDHFLLVDTGHSHHSGNNNWEILKKIIEKDQDILNGIYQLRDNALKTLEICRQENWSDLFICLNKEQALRGKYFSNWLNPSVSSLIDLMRSHGAKEVKLCGAGGGGCLLVLAEDRKNKRELEQVCEKNKIPIVMNW